MAHKTRTYGKRYTPEFREQAVRLVLEAGMTREAVANDLGISLRSVQSWVKIAQNDGSFVTADPVIQAQAKELHALRKRVRELEMEREILKKAAAFFAKESQ